MIYYQVRIKTKQYKKDEFLTFIRSLSPKIKKEKGCIGFNLYADSENEDSFVVIGKWQTIEAMKIHLQQDNYTILIGSAKVLGETIETEISEISELKGFHLVT